MAKTYSAKIDINTNADEAAKGFDNLSKATDKAADSANRLDASFEEIYGEMQPLTSRMGEAEDRLYELSLAGDSTSKEFQELITKVGEYRKVQIQTDLAVDAAATTLDQKMGGALTGATGAFSAVQGTMALVGGESEQLEKALLKVQSAMAIQQGVQGIRESLPMLKQMGTAAKTAFSAMTTGAKAFALTGIGVVLTAVAALSYALNEMEEEEKRVEEERQKRHDDEMARYEAQIQQGRNKQAELNRELDNEQKQREHKVRMLQAQGKSISEAEFEVAKGNMDVLLAKAQAAATEHNELGAKTEKMYADLASTYSTEWSQAEVRVYKAAQKQLDKKRALHNKRRGELKKEIAELKTLREDGYDDLEVLEAQAATRRSDNWKKYKNERLKAERLIIDLDLETEQEGERKDILISNERYKRKIEDLKSTEFTAKEKARLKNLYLVQQFEAEDKIKARYVDLEKDKQAKIKEEQDKADAERDRLNQEKFDKEDALFQLELDLMKDRQTAEIIALSQSYEEKYLLALNNAELTKQLDEQFLIDQAAIEDQFRLEKLAKDKEASDKQLALIEAERQAKLAAAASWLDISQQGAEAIQGIGDMVFASKMKNLEEGSKEEEEMARKQFKFNKAMQLTGAVIDAGKAIIASLASAPLAIGVVPSPIGIASLAATATMSAVNIAKIASTKFESAATPPDSNTSSLGGGGEAAAPEFNVVGDNGLNQVASLQQQPVQAYVVSGEVTTGQALDRNRVENATL